MLLAAVQGLRPRRAGIRSLDAMAPLARRFAAAGCMQVLAITRYSPTTGERWDLVVSALIPYGSQVELFQRMVKQREVLPQGTEHSNGPQSSDQVNRVEQFRRCWREKAPAEQS